MRLTVNPENRPTELQGLRSRPEVTEAWIVDGDYDIIARIVVSELSALDRLVMRIRHNPLIQKTCIKIAQVDFSLNIQMKEKKAEG